MLRKVAKRRKLSYQKDKPVDSLFFDSHFKKKSASVPSHSLQAGITVPHSISSHDWSRCKEGFSGFDVSTTQAKYAKNSSKKQHLQSVQKCSLKNLQGNEHQAEEISCGSSGDEIDSISSVSVVSNIDSDEVISQERVTAPRCNTPTIMACSVRSKIQTYMYERNEKTFATDKIKNKKFWSSLIKNPLEAELNYEIIDGDTVVQTASTNLNDRDVSDGNVKTGDAQPQPNKVEEACIGDYESDEELSERLTTSHHSQQGPSQDIANSATLSSMSSPSSSVVSPESQGRSRQTAAEWVKSLQWDSVTPIKSEKKAPEGGADSAKKKRCKFIRDGLADRLQKLQSREKTEQRIWNHKLSAAQLGSAMPHPSLAKLQPLLTLVGIDRSLNTLTKFPKDYTDNPKILTMRVLSCTYMGSLVITKCCHSYANTSDGSGNQTLVQTVYFARSLHVQEHIKQNSIIKIYPPWQKLHLPVCVTDVLFCTYYCVQAVHGEVEQAQPENKHLQDSVLTARWQCPCSIDANVLPKNCPAYVNPHTSFQPVEVHAVSSNPFHGNRLLSTFTSSPIATAGLETVLPTQCLSPSAPDSILEAMERMGHTSTKTLSFKVTVHRIIYKQNDEEQESCSLLASDHHGVFCLVRLPASLIQDDDWKSIIDHAEGCSCQVRGVKLQTRITKDREPALFSLIDRIWFGQQSSSQDSVVKQQDTESQEELLPKSTPGFCYLFDSAGVTDQSHCNTDIIQIIQSTHSSINNQFIMLCDVCKHMKTYAPECQRLSFISRVVCEDKYQKIQQSHYVHHTLYCTDNTLCTEDGTNPYVAVQLIRSRCLPDDLRGRIVSFTDVICTDGHLTADEYSRIACINQASNTPSQQERLPSVDSLSHISFQTCHLPELCDSSLEGELIKIEGNIEHIDENKAYSWQACDKCGQDTLYTDNTSAQQPLQMCCSSCGCTVVDPVMCISMEVLLRPQSSYTIDTDTVVRIDLLQQTIESLLPQESEEEGYDMESVIGQRVRPIMCILRENSRDKFNRVLTLHLKEVYAVFN